MKNLLILFMFFTISSLNCEDTGILNEVVEKECLKEEVTVVTIKENTIYDKIPEIIKILRVIESQNDPNAIGDNGNAKGVLQIHSIYVKEVNNRYGTSFKHNEMFDPVKAEEVTRLYMKFFIKYYNKKFNKMPTEKEIVQCHNFGAFQKFYDNGYYYRYCKEKNKSSLRYI